MAWTDTRYDEIMQILKETSSTRPPAEYPPEIQAFEKLAESEVIEKEVAGHVYKTYVWKSPKRKPGAPMYIYIHGGGWAIGHMNCDSYYSAWMADKIEGVVIDVDYTTSYGGGIDVMYAQCLDAADYAIGHAEELGCDPKRISIGGYSAGGHLTAGVVLKMLEEGRAPFAGMILCYAPLDLRFKPLVAPSNPREEIMQVRGAAFEELVLRGDDARRMDYIVSPVIAPKALLAKLPRTMVISAQLCEFKFEDEAFAATLSQIGVEVTSCRFTQSPHGFMPHFMKEWEEASLRTVRFIKSC